MRTKLTEKFIQTLEPKDKRYSVWDTEQPGLFLRVNPKGSITFFLFYRIDGKANDYALGRWGRITLTQARELARQKSGEVASGNDVQAVKKAAKIETERAKQDREKARKQTLRVFLDEHYEPWIRQHRKPIAVLNLRQLRSEFASWLDKPMPTLTPWLVEKHRQQRLKAGTRPATLNRYIAGLKSILSKAVDWEIIDTHPLTKIKPLKLDSGRKVRYLSDAEENRLRKTLTEQTRHVPLNDEAHDVLTRWKKQAKDEADDDRDIGDRYVFPAADGGRLDNIKKSFGKLLADADIDGFRFHDLRHHFASRLVMAGCDLNTVRELLGHANLEMTLRYAHLAPEHKAAAVALLNKGVA
jgi:hypothetical protein